MLLEFEQFQTPSNSGSTGLTCRPTTLFVWQTLHPFERKKQDPPPPSSCSHVRPGSCEYLAVHSEDLFEDPATEECRERPEHWEAVKGSIPVRSFGATIKGSRRRNAMSEETQRVPRTSLLFCAASFYNSSVKKTLLQRQFQCKKKALLQRCSRK